MTRLDPSQRSKMTAFNKVYNTPMAACQITTRTESGNHLVVALSGICDETVDLKSVIADKSFQALIVDWDQVKRINSSGVRRWLLFLQEYHGQFPIVVRKCPPAVVEQMSLIEGFLEGVRVASIYLPYLCPNCGYEASVLVEEKDFETLKNQLPVLSCNQCQAPKMEFDYIEESYFHFLTRPS